MFCQSQLPHRRVTFSTANQAQELQDASQHSYYDSGLEESETPSSKSSSGPRIGPLALPEDHYERTTPDGSIGEMEHPENGNAGLRPLRSSSSSIHHWKHGWFSQASTLNYTHAVKTRRVSRNVGVVFLIRLPQFPALCVHPLRRRVTSQRRNTINMQHNQLPTLLKLTSQLCKSQPVQPSISSTYRSTEGC